MSQANEAEQLEFTCACGGDDYYIERKGEVIAHEKEPHVIGNERMIYLKYAVCVCTTCKEKVRVPAY